MLFRVSEAEAFRQWFTDHEAGDEALEKLIAGMRGQRPPTPAMLAGTAFHKALETSPTGLVVDSIEAEGYRFTFAGDFTVELPTIRELRASKTYATEFGSITVTGQVDCIHGKRIEDHKTTGQFDADRYLKGYQWRYYLDIFRADVFRWNVFEVQSVDDPDSELSEWEVTAAHRLEQYRYPDLEADCTRLAGELARFARMYLPERVKLIAPTACAALGVTA